MNESFDQQTERRLQKSTLEVVRAIGSEGRRVQREVEWRGALAVEQRVGGALEQLPERDGDLTRVLGVRRELRADGGGAQSALELVLERLEVEQLRAQVAAAQRSLRLVQRQVLQTRARRRHRLTRHLHAAQHTSSSRVPTDINAPVHLLEYIFYEQLYCTYIL